MKEIINQEILPQQTSQICMYTSFLSVSDNDAFEAKEISVKGYCHKKRARYTCIPHSLSLNDMARLKRKKMKTA